MTKTLEALETLNNLLNGIDTSKYYDLLSEEEKQLEEEISDLDNGQVLWMETHYFIKMAKSVLTLKN